MYPGLSGLGIVVYIVVSGPVVPEPMTGGLVFFRILVHALRGVPTERRGPCDCKY